MECGEETELDGDGDRVLAAPVIAPRKKLSPINDSWPSSILFLISLPILTPTLREHKFSFKVKSLSQGSCPNKYLSLSFFFPQ